jgi:hypothetical protein
MHKTNAMKAGSTALAKTSTVRRAGSDDTSAAGDLAEPELEFHPIAEAFPLMAGVEFDALVADIKEHGLRERIVRFEGKILDGRNRYKASLHAGAAPQFVEYTGDDPLGFVLSANLHRRHLTEAQRAMAAAKLATLSPGRPAKSGQSADLTQEDAAKLLKVSERSIRRASEVIKHGIPELQQLVMSGEVSVSAAADVAADYKPDRQREMLAGGPKHIKDEARQIRTRGAAAKHKAQQTTNRTAINDTEASPVTPALPSTSADEFKDLAKRLQDLGFEISPDDLLIAPRTRSAQARHSEYALVRIPYTLPSEKRTEMMQELHGMRDRYNTQVMFTQLPK